MHMRFGRYRIRSDRYQYMLEEFRGTSLGKDGAEQERWENVGYYGRLEHLINALPDRVLLRSNGHLVKALNEMHEVCGQLLTALQEAVRSPLSGISVTHDPEQPPIRQPCPTPQKRAYLNRKVARRIARIAMKRDHKTLKVYRCQCRMYHLTSHDDDHRS